MNAIKFIQQHGVEKAMEVVEGAPEGTTHFRFSKFRGLSIYYDLFSTPKIAPMRWNRYSNKWYQLKTRPRVMIYFEQLKRLVESVDLVKKCGGIDSIKDTFDFAWAHGADELTGYGERLKQAIADYEQIFGGEHV